MVMTMTNQTYIDTPMGFSANGFFEGDIRRFSLAKQRELHQQAEKIAPMLFSQYDIDNIEVWWRVRDTSQDDLPRRGRIETYCASFVIEFFEIRTDVPLFVIDENATLNQVKYNREEEIALGLEFREYAGL